MYLRCFYTLQVAHWVSSFVVWDTNGYYPIGQKIIVSVRPEELGNLINSPVIKDISHQTFFEKFARFFVTFNWTNAEINPIFLRSILKPILKFNQAESKIASPLELWLAFSSSTDIFNAINVINTVVGVNRKFNGTITTIFLNYSSVLITSKEANKDQVSLVKNDIELCHSLKRRYKLKCGFVFNALNCVRDTSFFNDLAFRQDDTVIIDKFSPIITNESGVGYSIFLGNCKDAIKDKCRYGFHFKENLIQLDMKSQQYTYDNAVLHKIAQYNFVPLVNIYETAGNPDVSKPHNCATEIQGDLKYWMQQPLEIKAKNFGVALTLSDANKVADIMSLREIYKTMQTIFIESSSNISSFLKVVGKIVENTKDIQESSVNAISAKLTLVIEAMNSSLEVDISGIKRTAEFVGKANNLVPGVISAVLIHWNVSIKEIKKNNLMEKHDQTLFTTLSHLENELSTEMGASKVKTGLLIDHDFTEYFNDNELWKIRNISVESKLKSGSIFALKCGINHKDITENSVLGAPRKTTFEVGSSKLGLTVFLQRRIHKTFEYVYYFNMLGCPDEHECLKKRAEYVRFLESMCTFGEAKNVTMILAAPIRDQRVLQKPPNNNSLLVEHQYCGWWWTISRAEVYGTQTDQLIVIDKKTSIVNLYQKLQSSTFKPTPLHDTDAPQNTLWSIILFSAVLLGSVLTVATCFVVYYRLKRFLVYKKIWDHLLQGALPSKIENDGSSTSQDKVESLPYNKKKYEFRKTVFKIDYNDCLGNGEYCSVYRAVIKREGLEYDAAAKRNNQPFKILGHSNILAMKSLISEIKMLSYVEGHRNILRLEGAHTQEISKGVIYVFVEYCELGSLHSYLHRHLHLQGDLEQRNCSQYENIGGHESSEGVELLRDLDRWAYEIASGMAYLVSKGVVHADLATRNVLLNVLKCVKIADFGLSRRLNNDSEYIKEGDDALPWRWMPPESLKHFIFNEKSDMWSFGITLWEMGTFGDIPYPGLSWQPSVISLLEGGIRPGMPRYGRQNMYPLMNRCWHKEPHERPTFSHIVDCLGQQGISFMEEPVRADVERRSD